MVCPFILRFVPRHPAPRVRLAPEDGRRRERKGPERGLAGRSAHKHLGGKRSLDAKGSGINTSRVYFSSGSKLTRGKSEEASRRVSGLITGSVCKPERKKARAPRGGRTLLFFPLKGGGGLHNIQRVFPPLPPLFFVEGDHISRSAPETNRAPKSILPFLPLWHSGVRKRRRWRRRIE